MAQLTPGYEFQTGEAAAPAKFHQMVDDSFMVNVVAGDCAAGFKPIYKTTPASPSSGDVRVGSDGRLEFYFGGAWTTQESDKVAITLTNKSGVDLLKGSVVVPKHTTSGEFTLTAVDRTTDVIGVLAADIVNNASGLVYLRGRVQAFVTVGGSGGVAGDPLRGPDATLVGSFPLAARCFFSTTQLLSDTFATLLEACSAFESQLKWVRLGK